jgi:hypothetical protein
MEIITKTSIYELSQDPATRELILQKKKILQGKTSSVPAGQEYRGTRVEITHRGTLTLYKGTKRILTTSQLKNL